MKKKAQVVLETALVLIAVTLFFVGIMRVWAWFVNDFTGRWKAYNLTRAAAGNITTPGHSYNYTKETLDLFK